MEHGDRAFSVAGAGCGVADFLYPDIDFASATFRRFASRSPADGGLQPGRLVFREDFEAFAGCELEQALAEMVPPDSRPTYNVGGPALVAMVLVSQLLRDSGVRARYYGATGDDNLGRRIRSVLQRTPLDTSRYAVKPGPTPSTCVLCDPKHAAGHGERTFINTLGAAREFGPSDLDEAFYAARIRALGGTALVPQLHRSLDTVLARAREREGINIVHTVYDFLSERAQPGRPWPLVDWDAGYPMIDLLVLDAEEARRISGLEGLREAVDRFVHAGVHSLVVTNGPGPAFIYSDGTVFAATGVSQMPVSARVVRERAEGAANAGGDTTGCGDNLVGGIIASAAAQMLVGVPMGELDMARAAGVGICAGGITCFRAGGLHVEKEPGENAAMLADYYADYRAQVAERCALPESPL